MKSSSTLSNERVCQNIDSDKLFTEPGVVSRVFHHESYSELLESAGLGCEFCSAIVTTVLQGSRHLIPALENGYLRGRQILLRALFKGRAREEYEYLGSSRIWVACGAEKIAEFDVFVDSDSPLASREKVISGRPTCPDTASSETFAKIGAWIDECTNSHLGCSSETEAFVPTRLIDVSASDSHPRLVLSSCVSNGINRYATLSHRWGGSKPLTTTKETLSTRLQCIPMGTMPATFRDAVVATRFLGCRYLWIDSLCIIQNSAEDWSQEAAQMARIYRNSYITISADAAENCDAGIFKPRTVSFQPVRLTFNSKRRDLKGHFFIREALVDWESSINGLKSFLSSRAWCFQESMLSRRTIHFSQQQVFWSCCTKSIAESNVSPIPPPNRYGLDLGWTSNKRFLSFQPCNPLTPQALYLRWYVLIKAYVARNLTYTSDIFPALSGLASAFHVHLQNDTYIAGLWKNDIVRGLLWCTDDPAFTRYVKPARAPSWSWASVFNADPGLLRYASPQQMPFWSWASAIGQQNEQEIKMMVSPRAEVLRAETTLLRPGTGQFGEVEGGILELNGPWMDATSWDEDIDKFWWEWHPFGNMKNEGFISVRFDVGHDDDVQDILKERREMRRTLALLQVAKWGDGVGRVVGVLILESGTSPGIWRRRGYGEINQAEDAWLDSWPVGRFAII